MKKIPRQLLFGFLILLISSCQHDDIIQPLPTNPSGPVDDLIKVMANVTGVVLDENNIPVGGATVNSGTAITTTNALGMFYLGNISLSKNNGSVTVTKAGYYKGVRSFKTTAGRNHQVKIQLMQRILSGTLNAATGGNINSNGTATINFPANVFITGTGAAYTGTVKVYSRWIDPTAANLPAVMPGDLRGIRTNNTEDLLKTFGMIGAELEDAAGNTLSLAPGKKAAISIPIPGSLVATATDTIVMLHFDNATARWKEEGIAIKVGNTYQAQVNKFSFWNGANCTHKFTQIDFTLINSANNTPFAGITTSVKLLSTGDKSYGVTNDQGFVSGYVFKNEVLVLEVYGGECPTPIYSQNIGPFNSNTSLGNISVSLPASKYITFSGKIVNCNTAPVTNGYISLLASGGNHGFANTNASGNFSFSILNCTGSNLNYSYYAVDIAASQQSNILTGTSTPATVNMGTITACGSVVSSGDVFVSGWTTPPSSLNNVGGYWKNGVFTAFNNTSTSVIANSVYVSGNDVYVAGKEIAAAAGTETLKLWKNGVATNLTSGATYVEASGVWVSGSDVYVTGTVTISSQKTARVWKNGVASILPGGTSSDALFVSGNDVYVAGETASFNSVVWKNGTIIYTNPFSLVVFNAIFVLGTDIYLAGSYYNGTNNIAKTWKNGVATDLTNGLSGAEATGIFVSGNDVYAVGNVSNASTFFTTATLWKNGVATNLTNGLRYGHATGIKVVGTDVYVCGREQQGSPNIVTVAMLWKNGFPINLSDGTQDGYGTSLFVK